MNKEEYNTLSEIKKLDDELGKEIDFKEMEVAKLRAQIDQIYIFRKQIQFIGEIESMRIDRLIGDSNEQRRKN